MVTFTFRERGVLEKVPALLEGRTITSCEAVRDTPGTDMVLLHIRLDDGSEVSARTLSGRVTMTADIALTQYATPAGMAQDEDLMTGGR